MAKKVRHKKVDCPTGKVGVRTRGLLTVAAGALARDLNQARKYASDLYGYHCTLCSQWHLTRHAEFRGMQNDLVHRAAPRELQEWAMPPENPSPRP